LFKASRKGKPFRSSWRQAAKELIVSSISRKKFVFRIVLATKDKRKRFLQRIRVPLGFALAILLIALARPTPLSLGVGGAIAFAGVLIRAWAAGHIYKFEKLAVTGPYSHTRNPLYFGSFLLAAGFAAAAGVWWLAVFVAVLYLSIYFPVMRVEEGDLRSRFGGEFENFARNVPLFFPRLTRWKKTGAGFDFQLYLKHREYQASAGTIIALAILAAKMYFFSER
jgi:protein-S-isoprenylcysteine O-methyltransferase Ste14